jgi:hypothetical protein
VPGAGSGHSGIAPSGAQKPENEVILPRGTKPHKGCQSSDCRFGGRSARKGKFWPGQTLEEDQSTERINPELTRPGGFAGEYPKGRLQGQKGGTEPIKY